MQITNNGFDAETGKVEVVFLRASDAFKHTRQINAVVTAGAYNADATADRIAEHVPGVEYKMDRGLIRNENIPLPDMTLPDPVPAESDIAPTGEGTE